jgi:CMP-N-acetylneuraminic acid synthetase
MICIIPQHAQSERLPRKAFRDICGIPLVAWSVIQAKAAHSVEAVYVSTESQEIAEICAQYGAEIIWRPQWLQDKAFSASVPLEHALHELGIHDKHEPFLSKLATSPLLFPDDIDRVHARFLEAEGIPIGIGKQVVLGADVPEIVAYRQVRNPEDKLCVANYVDKSQKAVIPFGAMNIVCPDSYLAGNRRAEWFFEAGEVTDADMDDEFVDSGKLIGNALLYYVPCRAWQTIDIDDEQGLEMVEMFMEHKILKGKGAEIYYEYARSRD